VSIFSKPVFFPLSRIFQILTLTLLASMAQPGATFAQGQQGHMWIQVESKNNLRDTRARARFFAESFPDTHAFQTTSPWNAIAIGPMTADEARAQLARLKQEGRIPPDSFLSDGRSFRSQLWPLSATNTATLPTNATTPSTTPPDGTVVIEEGPAATPKAEATPKPTPAATATAAPAPAQPKTQSQTPATRPAPEAKVTQDVPATNTTQTAPPLPAAATPKTPIGPIPDPDLRASRLLERGWTGAQRKQYQTYLVWTGDYASAIDGAYGPGTRKAIRRFQKREGYQETGFLTGNQLVLLQKRYDAIQTRLGVSKLTNLDAGIGMLYPSKLVTFARFEPPFVHYKATPGSKIRMMLISQKGGRDMLTGLYDIMSTFDDVPPDGYRKKRRDWFVLSGRNDKVVSYTYARVSGGNIKGFTLVWPPEMDREMKPLVTAMYNSFTPLDDYVLDETLGYGRTKDQPVDLSKGLDVPVAARAATGFFVNAEGAFLTSIPNVEGCQRITVGDGTEMAEAARNPDLGLVVLRAKKPFTPKSFALFSDETPALGTEVSVAGFSFPEVMDNATLNYGTITDTKGLAGDRHELRVSAFLEKGDAGGPVLDDRGAVLGLNLLKPASDSGLPEYVNFALKTGEITAMLEAGNITYGTSRALDPVAPEDLAAMAGDFTAKASCWH